MTPTAEDGRIGSHEMTLRSAIVSKRLHVVSARDIAVGYEPATGRLFRVSDLDNADHDVPGSGVVGRTTRRGKRDEPPGTLWPRPAATSATLLPPASSHPSALKRLSLHVSHDCNLRCRYCYAGGGDYGQPRQRMTAGAAREIVRRVGGSTGRIGLIGFFGGEPLLATDALEVACTTALELHQDGTLDRPPRYRIVTNLSLLPPRFVELVRRFDIEVVVSCDGPAAIHDRLRPFAGGRGSFGMVVRNIARLQQATAGRQPRCVEATYTRLHQQAGMTRGDLRSYVCKTLGVREAIIAPAQATVPTHYELVPRWSDARADHVEYARLALRALSEGDTEIDASGVAMLPYVVDLSQGACDHFCAAGTNRITVTPAGDIYPCHMFIGRGEFRMGNVLDDPDYQTSRAYRRVANALGDNRKVNVVACQECWLRRICRACPGLMLMSNGAIDRPLESECILRWGLAEGTLLELASLQQDPARWARFTASVKRNLTTAGRAVAHEGPRGVSAPLAQGRR